MAAAHLAEAAPIPRIQQQCAARPAPRLCAIRHHRRAANRWRTRVGSTPLPLGPGVYDPSARRGVILYHWWQRHIRARAYTRALWRWYYTSGAQCVHDHEGGWHEASGNGYTGGFQYLASTWASAGGLRYAPAAYLATPLEQIRVTRARVRVDKGWHEWGTAGVCGLG